MVTESIVVILLTLLIAYIYLRRGKRGMAASVLPLAALPAVTLLGNLLRTTLLENSIMPVHQWRLLLVVVGLGCGGALIGLFGSKIHKKSARRLYLLLCGSFTVMFAFLELLAIVG